MEQRTFSDSEKILAAILLLFILLFSGFLIWSSLNQQDVGVSGGSCVNSAGFNQTICPGVICSLANSQESCTQELKPGCCAWTPGSTATCPAGFTDTGCALAPLCNPADQGRPGEYVTINDSVCAATSRFKCCYKPNLPSCGPNRDCRHPSVPAGSSQCTDSVGTVTNCCAVGKVVVNNECVDLPTCGSGLQCSASSVSGSTKCINSSVTIQYCCASGQTIQNGACFTPTGGGPPGDDGPPGDGGTPVTPPGDGGTPGGDTAPEPQDSGVALTGRVMCRASSGNALPVVGATIQLTRDGAAVRTVTTDASGQFSYTYPSTTRRTYTVRVLSLPSGTLANGVAYSAMTGPNAVFCTTMQENGCRGSNGNYCGGGGTFYNKCESPPGAHIRSFRFIYTNCGTIDSGTPGVITPGEQALPDTSVFDNSLIIAAAGIILAILGLKLRSKRFS